MSNIIDEWCVEEDGKELHFRFTYEDGMISCGKHFFEELLKKAGFYKYEENINVTNE